MRTAIRFAVGLTLALHIIVAAAAATLAPTVVTLAPGLGAEVVTHREPRDEGGSSVHPVVVADGGGGVRSRLRSVGSGW